MNLPVDSADLSLRYSLSLGAMDLRTLNPFVQIAGRTRLNSGALEWASCDIEVRSGHAQGKLEAVYHGVDVTMLDRQTRSEKGLVNRLQSIFVDQFTMRTSNPPDKGGPSKIGEVDYTRKPEEKFLHFVWFGIRSGIFDLLGLSPYVKAAH